MNRQKWICLVVVLAMFAGAACVLATLKTHQRLGNPGLRWKPTTDPIRVEIVLPETVPGYTTEEIPEDPIAVKVLPSDTSFAQRWYSNELGQITVNVVLMGTDRTSIHKPQFCLEGAGWHIDPTASREEMVHMDRPQPYDLPVMKLIANHSQQVTVNGQTVTPRCVYVYWFVADGEYTARHAQRMWWMARDIATTGVLQRWAYITYAATCLPGGEDATFEAIKKLIVATVPDFQLVPKPLLENPRTSNSTASDAASNRKNL